MSEKYSPVTRNTYADWGGGDTGPRQFKHKKPKIWDDAAEPHKGGGKLREDDQRAIEQGDVAVRRDGELSIFAGDETLAKEIANKDGRSGEAIGEREVQGVVDSEAAVGVAIQPESVSSSVQAPSMPPAQRRANTRRIKRGKSAEQPTDTASTFDTKAVDLDSTQPAAYSDDSTFGPYESPATYSDNQAFGPDEYPATYGDGQAFGPYESPATYSGDSTFGPYESPAIYNNNQLFGPNDYPATYGNSQTFGPYESPATYSDDTTFGPLELPVRGLVRSEKYKDARDAYDTADKELAGSVARRLKLGMFTTKKTREAHSAEVEAAAKAYDDMSQAFDTIQVEKWKLAHPAISEEEITHKLANYHEAKLRLQGLRAQSELVTSQGKFGKLSEWNNKATEWYAGLSRGKKIGFALGGIAVGVAAGGLVAVAGTVLGATAGVAGGGLLAGAKVYKTAMQGRAKLHRNTVEVNKADFKNADGTYKSIDQLREQSAATFQTGLQTRVERADKVNKNAKWMTIASAALLGAGVAGHIDVVHDAYKAVGDHVAGLFDTSHQPIGVTDSQGGGSGANDSVNLGSGDVNPHNQYTFTHHDTPVAPPEVVPEDLGGATEFNSAGLDHFNQWANGHTVQPGESVWKLSQDYLQANGVRNPSVYQIDAVKDKVLAEFSAKGLVDGSGWLTAGQQLRIQ